MERFEQEVSVLRVEGQKHNAGQLGFDLSLRFGPNGPGLLGWPEHGLHRLDPAEARGWAARWFTAANAVLWLSAPPPPELDLSALPKGRKRRRQAPGPELIECPTWVPARTNMISVSVTSEQQWALTPGLAIARDRALERLRTHAGVTYTVDFAHVRLPGGKALEFLSADGAQGSHGAVLEGMLEVVEQLSEDGPTGDELALWQDLRRQFHNAPQALTGYLDSSAERRVLGLSTPTRDEVDQRLDELTADQISAELQAVGKSLLAIGPSEIGDDVIGLSSITNWSDHQLLGDEYQPIDGRERGTLVIGDEGISWILDETHFRTVPWNTVVGVTAWDNGSRTVIGANGSSVVVVPWNWRQGEDLPELIDKSVGDRLIRLGAGITDTNNGGVGENWSAKVQWLASLMGARCGKRSVDLVLRTDGLLLLHRAVVAIPSTRLEELRTKEPADLMADDPHAKW